MKRLSDLISADGNCLVIFHCVRCRDPPGPWCGSRGRGCAAWRFSPSPLAAWDTGPAMDTCSVQDRGQMCDLQDFILATTHTTQSHEHTHSIVFLGGFFVLETKPYSWVLDTVLRTAQCRKQRSVTTHHCNQSCLSRLILTFLYMKWKSGVTVALVYPVFFLSQQAATLLW